MIKVLVTGGLGFIGSNLVDRLSKEYQVTVVDNLSSARNDFEAFIESHPEVEFIKTCFSDKKILKRISGKEFDYVFHVAAVPRVSYSVENPYTTTEENLSKTVMLLESCKKSIKRFIFSSSSSVYGDAKVLPTKTTAIKSPQSPYAWQKSSIEDVLSIFKDLYGLDSVCLRYFNVFGPGQFGDSPYSTAISAWCDAIKNGKKLRSDGTGEQSRDLCYIDNVVEANILSMLYEESLEARAFNVACGDRISNNQILKYLKNRYPKIEIYSAPKRPGDVMHTQADIGDTTEILNYNNYISFWEGLERTINWWKL